MALKLNCPSCGALLELSDETAITVQCQYCHNTVAVPENLHSTPAPWDLQKIQQEFPQVSTILGQLSAHPDKIRQMVDFAKSGKKIEAIKIYREIFGVGLVEAKDAIDQLAATGHLQMVQTQTQVQVSTPETATFPASQMAEVNQLVREGKKIEAIKRLREITSMGLKEAKDVVDAVEKARSGFEPVTPMREPWAPTASAIEAAPFPPADVGIPEEKSRGSSKTFLLTLVILIVLLGLGAAAFVLMTSGVH